MKNNLLLAALASALALGLSASSLAQTLPLSSPLPLPGVSYRAGVTTPAAVLGVEIGARHLLSHEIQAYFQAVAAQSDRVRLFTHGRSHQGRPLAHAVISSPRNLARWEELREQNRRLLTEPDKVTDAELEKMPLVLWMGFGVHGNEASVCEAAMLTLYHLAAGQGASIERVLEETVVLLVPNFNPDGRDRFAQWANNNRGQNPTSDPQDRERLEPWPGGRTNHYWFDLNRDWLPLTQPESESRHKVWTDWRPQVTLDYHEMGSQQTYFFPPGIPERVHPLTPKTNIELTDWLASRYANALDRVGERYFTQERFDDFYPGKGSTYPDVAGSLGILFEQGGTRSLVTETQRGLLDFPTTIRNQMATSIASLEAGVEGRVRFLRYQRDVFRDGLTRRAPFAAARWADSEAGRDLAKLLLKHEIVVGRDSQGRFVVPMNQPLSLLAQTVFQRVTQFQDNQFYDVSTWTLDAAFGVDVERLAESPAFSRLTTVPSESGAVANLRTTDLGWVVRGDNSRIFGAVNALLQARHQVFLLRRPFNANLRRGDFYVPRQTGADEALRLASARFGVRADAVAGQTGDVVSLGGDGALLLERPSVALVVGSGTTSNRTGELWHLLDTRWGMSVSLLDADRLATADLSRYTAILMGGGAPPAAAVEPLRAWINRGGRLVASGSSAEAVATAGLWPLTVRRHTPRTLDLPYDQIAKERGRHTVPGTILRAKVDTTHPLAIGLPAETLTFREQPGFFAKPDTSGAVVASYTENPVVCGYASPEIQALMPGSPAFLARREGRGAIILIPDQPNFRAFYRNGHRKLGNAIFWGSSF